MYLIELLFHINYSMYNKHSLLTSRAFYNKRKIIIIKFVNNKSIPDETFKM